VSEQSDGAGSDRGAAARGPVGRAAATTGLERVHAALEHRQPDRVPVDFLATPEIWGRVIERVRPDSTGIPGGEFFEAEREALLRHLEVDCRVISYDMFCAPPDRLVPAGAEVSWWTSPARSTPNRAWRLRLPDGRERDIWGHELRTVTHEGIAYEEYASWPLASAESVADLAKFDWPEPDWWDFGPVRQVIDALDSGGRSHLRFRAGSVLELAWQLRGLEQFMMDLALEPEMAGYMMDRLTEVHVENTRRVLELARDRIDMIYFYDDVGAQDSLLLSKPMWRELIRPRHARIIEAARSFGAKVMYHTDGAVRTLLPEIIDMGVDVLNPVQPSARDMAPADLKRDFGERLCFHGGIDIVNALRVGTPDDVRAEARERVATLGAGGGYIMCSSHHIQADSPIDNVLALYELDLR
jgi:uroporphyrinogen decarboxylase